MGLLAVTGSSRRRSAGGGDADALSYFTRAGITDTAEKANITALIAGMKTEGIWSSLTDLWLLRPNQQSTGGTTMFALKNNANNGTLNGTGLPAFSTHGVEIRNSTQRVATPISVSMNQDFTAGAVFRCFSNPLYSRLLGTTPPTIGGYSLMFLRYTSLNPATIGSYSGAEVLGTIGNVGVHNFAVSAYDRNTVTPASSPYQALQNSATASTAVNVNHAASTHTLALNGAASGESFGNGDVSLFFLWLGTRITNAQISNFYALLKTTVSQGLSLP